MKNNVTAIALVLLAASAHGQQLLQVPANFPTIQAAIGSASPGDTIQVAAGTYFENIDFLGKEIQLIGAGIGQTILDGGQNGSVISMTGGEGPGTLVQDLTIQNGTGTSISAISGPIIMGGGVFLKSFFNSSTGQGLTQPTFRRCRIAGNFAEFGSGVALWNGVSLFEDCVFENNSGGVAAGSVFNGQNYVFLRCRFLGNTADSTPALSIGFGGGLGGVFVVDRCFFGQNVATGNPSTSLPGVGGAVGLDSGDMSFLQCIFEGNTANQGGALAAFNGCAGHKRFENCLFLGNVALQDGGVLAVTSTITGTIDFVNCTMADNLALSQGNLLRTLGGWSSAGVDFVNSIIRGGTPGVSMVSVAQNNLTLTPTFKHCDIEGGWTGPGFGNFDADPLFEDAMNGDYRIRPDSPCVDTGLTLTGANAVVEDFDGDPRPLFGGVDIGYDECGDFVLDPAVAGTVGLAATGSAIDVLSVNGSSGGALRRVDLALFQPIQFGVALPPGHPGGADFVLYGLLGAPSYASVASLPFGLPTMVVPPCDLFPTFQPLLFTLASSVTGLGCQPAFAAPGGAPWTSGPLAGLPFPVTFGLQGLIVEDAQGAVAATNALRVSVE